MMLNVGPTRADDLPGINKIELPTGLVMRDVAKSIMYVCHDEYVIFHLTRGAVDTTS
jgi:hypothetical protein